MDPIPAFTVDVALTLAVTGAALGLFVWNRLRLEVVGLLVMITLVVTGLITPEEGIAGFSNEATVTVALMLGLSAAMVRTGAIDALGRWVERFAGEDELRLTLTLLVLVVPVSALINNTAAVAILLPMVLGLSRRAGLPPSRLLMPLSFGSQMGGTLTLIGTSTNLLVAGMILDLGLPRIQLFDITPPALILAAAGCLYLLTLGRRLIPWREPAEKPFTSRRLRSYLSELTVREGSPLIGRDVETSGLEADTGLEVVGLRRGNQRLSPHQEGFTFQADDRLLVRGRPEEIASVLAVDHLTLVATAAELEAEEREVGELRLAEVIVSPRSRAVGRSLAELERGLPGEMNVLALQRHGAPVDDPIEEVPLASGDILLVRAPLPQLQALHEEGDFALLGLVELPPRRTAKAGIAVAILAGVVLAAAFEVTTILVAALVGMVAMVLTGCIRPREVYQEMDWSVVILLGSLLALGTALQKTGTAELLAAALLAVARPLGPYGMLAAFYLLTSLLTELITNNASALVLTPIAVATASALQVSALPFVVAVMFAASNSFATPIGYQTNLFIYGPGGYQFSDFLRVGGPLVMLMAALATWAIPRFFPF